MLNKLYKIENFFYKIKIIPVAFLIRLFMRIIFSCDIPYKLKMGKNVVFPHHALGVVIHQDAVIGDNCKILQGVTIGGKSNSSILPKIGNNVLIGAGAIILGPITIGDNSVIGAGSVVVKSVKNGEIVAGNPAKKIK